MKQSRRAFLASAAAVSLGASCQTTSGPSMVSSKTADPPAGRRYPLEGIDRHNITITDLKMTPLTYEMKPNEYWATADYICWRTDSILVEVFTDQGIVGIGGASQYGGPEEMLD